MAYYDKNNNDLAARNPEIDSNTLRVMTISSVTFIE